MVKKIIDDKIIADGVLERVRTSIENDIPDPCKRLWMTVLS